MTGNRKNIYIWAYYPNFIHIALLQGFGNMNDSKNILQQHNERMDEWMKKKHRELKMCLTLFTL